MTQEVVNLGQRAHIFAFSPDGPRPARKIDHKINDIANLMLLCHGCHKLIDSDKAGVKYSGDLLQRWKADHERRIWIVTGIVPNKRSHVIRYGANIGAQSSIVDSLEVSEALFPDRFPASEKSITLSMSWSGKEDDELFWQTEASHLAKAFAGRVQPLIEDADPAHFSVFALAPIPLLVKLGTLFTDKAGVDVYQLHREPKTWKWVPPEADLDFVVNPPDAVDGPPALVLSLSAKIDAERVRAIMPDASIWEVTIADPHNDFLRARDELAQFRTVMRAVISQMARAHGAHTPIAIFPAMPVACAVELGRIRMPKADSLWRIYDHINTQGRFVPTLEIGAAL